MSYTVTTLDQNVGLFNTQNNPSVPKSLDLEADWERCLTPRRAESLMSTNVGREDDGKERTLFFPQWMVKDQEEQKTRGPLLERRIGVYPRNTHTPAPCPKDKGHYNRCPIRLQNCLCCVCLPFTVVILLLSFWAMGMYPIYNKFLTKNLCIWIRRMWIRNWDLPLIICVICHKVIKFPELWFSRLWNEHWKKKVLHRSKWILYLKS